MLNLYEYQPQPDEIKAARLGNKQTQSQAAALINRTAAAWCRWEEGHKKMPPELWELYKIKIAEFFL